MPGVAFSGGAVERRLLKASPLSVSSGVRVGNLLDFFLNKKVRA